MKTIVYILLIIGVVMLATSKDLRVKATNVLKMLRENVDRHVVRGDQAEIRMVKAADFDSVTNEPGRLVVVVIDKEMKTSKTENHALDDEFKKLPGKVLIARISAERSGPLLQRLRVTTLPHVRIYRQGQLLEKLFGKVVNTSKLIDAIQYHLEGADTSFGSGGEELKPMSH